MSADYIFFDYSNLEISEERKIRMILERASFQSIVTHMKTKWNSTPPTNSNCNNHQTTQQQQRQQQQRYIQDNGSIQQHSQTHQFNVDSVKNADKLSFNTDALVDDCHLLTKKDYINNNKSDVVGSFNNNLNVVGNICNIADNCNNISNINNNISNNIINVSNNINDNINNINNNTLDVSNNNINHSNKVRSWASLLKDPHEKPNGASLESKNIINGNKNNDDDNSDVAVGNSDVSSFDYNLHGEFHIENKVMELFKKLVKSHIVSTQINPVVPRGFTNKSNRCYANSTLQALLICPPFCNFINSLKPIDIKVMEHLKLPVLKSLVEIYRKLETIKPTTTTTTSTHNTAIQQQQQHQRLKNKHQKQQQQQQHDQLQQQQIQLKIGPPLDTNLLSDILESTSYKAFELNQQEDAEEFLSYLLNKLHEEMVHLCKYTDKLKTSTPNPNVNGNHEDPHSNNHHSIDYNDDDQNGNAWQQARSKNKFVNCVDPSNLECSPITEIFRGQIAYLLECPGQKDSVSLQPFIALQLDVQHSSVNSVHEALKKFVSRESVSNYTNSSKIKVEATKRTLFEVLPRVLVLHFKWFKYDAEGGLLKNTKQFLLDDQLEIHSDFLTSHSNRKLTMNQKKYELFAVVNHIGSQAVGGHYYTDAYHETYAQWLRYDDEKIHKVKSSQVIHYTHPRVPYLAFYKQHHMGNMRQH